MSNEIALDVDIEFSDYINITNNTYILTIQIYIRSYLCVCIYLFVCMCLYGRMYTQGVSDFQERENSTHR